MYKPQSLRGRPGRLQGGGAIRASAAVPSAAGGAGGPRRPRDGVQASASPALEVQEADSVAIFQRSWDVYQRALTYDSMHHQQLYSIIRQRAEQLQVGCRGLCNGPARSCCCRHGPRCAAPRSARNPCPPTRPPPSSPRHQFECWTWAAVTRTTWRASYGPAPSCRQASPPIRVRGQGEPPAPHGPWAAGRAGQNAAKLCGARRCHPSCTPPPPHKHTHTMRPPGLLHPGCRRGHERAGHGHLCHQHGGRLQPQLQH